MTTDRFAEIKRQADDGLGCLLSERLTEVADVRLIDIESWALVTAAQHGDTDAITHLYRGYIHRIRGFIEQQGIDWATAEDLTTEVFIRFLRALPTLTYQGRSPRNVLMRIAVNLALDHQKTWHTRTVVTVPGMYDLDRAIDGPESTVLDRETATETALLITDIIARIDRLIPSQRDCLRLRFLQGCSVADTATALGVSVGATKQLQGRGTRRIRTDMTGAAA